ncbi:unnamed protein product [marine sediment metagenome]|uniref:Transglycosylase SLT domain-containing protein n=1 Tax=marine sediment metagenome TaxID=412755 RepID=X0YRA5_9ZZZZ
MSIKPSHLRDLIDETLHLIVPSMHTVAARELLMMTAAQESHCGRYLVQQGCGVALGIFQMEPATYHDLFDNYLRYHQVLKCNLEGHFKVHVDNFRINLQGNLPYQIVIARLQYRRFPEALPGYNSEGKLDTYAMACYYKKYWNTHKGKATVAEALYKYDKYAK